MPTASDWNDIEFYFSLSYVFSSIDFSKMLDGGWIGNHTYGDSLGNFSCNSAGTGPRTPTGVIEVGKSYQISIRATVNSGACSVWYWDGSNNRNLGDISESSFDFECLQSDGQVYLRASQSNTDVDIEYFALMEV